MKSRGKLEKWFSQGKLSRREFLGRASAIGVLATLGPLAWSKSVLATPPKKGGRFRLGMAGGATTDNLDPALSNDHMMQIVNWQLRNCLVEIDHANKAIPELAESWEAGSGAKVWTFKLRKGIEFHNAKTLDAQDVVYSMNRHRGAESKSVARPYLKTVTEIRTDGKDRVIFMLDSGNSDFPFLLGDTHLTIVPDGTTNFDAGIGTGGYVLSEFQPGVRTLAKRNPNYWKADRAHFDEIEVLHIADGNSRTAALQAGTIDAMNRCDLKSADFLKKLQGIQVNQVAGAKHLTLPMRTDVAPYDSNDARLALKYAIDREQILKLVMRGYGSLGNDTPIGRTYRFYNRELPQRVYDPEKAKFHLKKAGITGQAFTLNASDAAFNIGVEVAILFKEHARLAGLDINVVREPSDGYWKNVWMKKPWTTSYYSGKPTEDWMFSQAYAVDSQWNETFWTDERFNTLLRDARSELNEDKRRAMYYEMQQILWERGGTIIPIFADTVEATLTKVKFGTLASNFDLDGLRCSERWWFV